MAAPRKFDVEARERAVRMYQEHLADAQCSKVATRTQVDSTLGLNPATVRNWIEAGSTASSPGSTPESARLALTLGADSGVEQRAGLAERLFSLEGAVALLHSHAHPRPEVGPSELVDRLEGRILRKLILADPA